MRLVHTTRRKTNRNALFIDTSFPRGFSEPETETETRMETSISIDEMKRYRD